MSRFLVRKCPCGQVLKVEVEGDPITMVERVEGGGILLSGWSRGSLLGIAFVWCPGCRHRRHIRKFEEMKVAE